jgi:hypothetical protein
MLWASGAWGACPSGTCYVAVGTGSDAAAGTIGAPLASVEYALENMSATGDAVILRTGTYDSTGLWKSGSDKQILANKNISVSAYTGESVTINIPSDTTSSGLFYLGGVWSFNGINFTNTNSRQSLIGYLAYNAASQLTYNDCTIDYNNTAKGPIRIDGSINGYDASVTLNRTKVKNLPANTAFIVNAIGGGHTATITSTASLFRNIGWIMSANAGINTILNFTNNTVANLKNNMTFYSLQSTDTVTLSRNIFRADSTYLYPIYAYNTNWTVSFNNIYRTVSSDPELTNTPPIIVGTTYPFPTTATNYYLNPQFANEGADDYTLLTGSLVAKRGSGATGTDLNGVAFSDGDIGCYHNPVITTPSLVSGTIACAGDSIAQGLCNRAKIDGWLPYSVVGDGNLGAAIGGSRGDDLSRWVDRAAETWHPQYIVLLSWHNNFNDTTNVPTGITAQQASDSMMVAVAKAKYWGMTPIVLGQLGVSSSTAAYQYTKPLALNALLDSACVANSCLFDAPINRMRFNSTWMNAYNNTGNEGYYGATGLSGNVHPHDLGYQLVESVLDDLLRTRKDYWITQPGTSVVGSKYGPATYRFPISIAGINAQTSPALPTGAAGMTVEAASNTFSSQFVAPVDGTSAAPFIIHGGIWNGGAPNLNSFTYWTYNPLFADAVCNSTYTTPRAYSLAAGLTYCTTGTTSYNGGSCSPTSCSWTCTGIGGGTNANCTALYPLPITFTPGATTSTLLGGVPPYVSCSTGVAWLTGTLSGTNNATLTLSSSGLPGTLTKQTITCTDGTGTGTTSWGGSGSGGGSCGPFGFNCH